MSAKEDVLLSARSIEKDSLKGCLIRPAGCHSSPVLTGKALTLGPRGDDHFFEVCKFACFSRSGSFVFVNA